MANIYLTFLIMIIIYWFSLSTTLAYISADPVINQGGNIIGNASTLIDINTDNINVTGGIAPTGAGGVLDMTARMFTFRIPPFLPASFNFIISFLNWVLLIVLGICVFKLASVFT